MFETLEQTTVNRFSESQECWNDGEECLRVVRKFDEKDNDGYTDELMHMADDAAKIKKAIGDFHVDHRETLERMES